MEQQQDVRIRILNAAKTLFAERGYNGTSIRQICELADSNIALVSYHFGGKENVFFELFAHYSPAQNIDLTSASKDPIEDLCRIIRKIIEFRDQEPQMVSILQQEFFMNSPRLQVIYSNYIGPVWTKVRSILEDGKQRGLFDFMSLDRALINVMAIIIFPCRNRILDEILTDRDENLEDIVKDTIEFMLYGLNCKKNNRF